MAQKMWLAQVIGGLGGAGLIARLWRPRSRGPAGPVERPPTEIEAPDPVDFRPQVRQPQARRTLDECVGRAPKGAEVVA